MRQPLGRMPVEIAFVQRAHDLGLQPVPHRRDTFAFGRHFLVAQLAGLPKADDQRDGEGPGTHAALMAAAVNHGDQPDPGPLLPDVQRSDTFRPINFVGRERHQVHAQLVHIHGNFADALCCIAVK